MATTTSTNDAWPALPLAAWSDTYATLHLYLQIVGKVRLALSPWVNHSWHVALHLSARGLTTSVIPYGNRVFEIELDFIDHTLSITTADGMRGGFALEAQPVATFYARLMEELRKLGLTVMIRLMPNEIPDAIPLDQDQTHATYDGEGRESILARARAVASRVHAFGWHGASAPAPGMFLSMARSPRSRRSDHDATHNWRRCNDKPVKRSGPPSVVASPRRVCGTRRKRPHASRLRRPPWSNSTPKGTAEKRQRPTRCGCPRPTRQHAR